MIGVPELLQLAIPIPPVSDGSSAIEQLVRTLPGRRPKMPSSGPRLLYPRSADYGAITTQLKLLLAREDDKVVAAALETLVRPLRAYPIGQARSGRFVLISSYEGGLVVSACVDVSTPDVDFKLMSGRSRPQIARELEGLHSRILQQSRLGDHKRLSGRRAMFVADPGRIGKGSGPGWMQAVEAICESWGYDVVFDQTPVTARARTMQHMDTFAGAAVILVIPAVGSFCVVTARHPRWRHRTVELESTINLFDELRLNFELGLVEPPRVESFEQFADRADELEGSYFVLTPECREALRSSGYFAPSRLWSSTALLSEAARQRCVEGWTNCGPMALWIRDRVGLEVALTDPNLGDTSFTFDGVELSWEPHVKVDDAKDELIRVGRIYFAIDDANERLVVYHIGIHL
jgi:hypothetical protein